MIPAAVPIIGEAQTGTKPAQGVMVARPAMDPVSKPTNLGFFSRIHSMIIQAMVANEAAISVFRNAVDVTKSTCTSLPALNPYHPNHSNPLPIAMRGMLLGVEYLSTRAPT